MNKKTSTLLSILLVLTTLFMVLVPNIAKANTQTGSLTINKLESDSDNNNYSDNNKIAGAGFTIYKVADDETSTELDSSYVVVTAEKVTDSNGQVKFDNLAVGRYLVIETTTPNNATTTLANFLVDVPQYSSTGVANYDVEVYPKNTLGFGEVTLFTYDKSNNNTQIGASYSLEYLDGSDWKAISTIGTNNNGTSVSVPTLVTTSEDGLTVSNLPIGTYRFTETSVPEKYIMNTTPITFTVENDNNSVVVKDATDTTVTQLSDYIYKPSISKVQEAGKDTVTLGDTIKYTVTLKVPADNVKSLKELYVVDTLSDGLNFDSDLAVSIVSGTNTLTAVYDYTVSVNSSNNVATITFTASGKAKLSEEVTLEYSAKVVDVTNKNLNNSAVLYYTANDNTTTSETPTTTDPASGSGASTYSLTITKTDGTNVITTGATFALSTVNNNTDSDGNPNNKYLVSTDGTTTTQTFTTGVDGTITVYGLKAGTYYLYEITAPTYTENGETKSYQKLTTPTTITVTDNDVTATVVNHKSLALPATGATSAIGIFVLGALIIGYGMKVYKDNKED